MREVGEDDWGGAGPSADLRRCSVKKNHMEIERGGAMTYDSNSGLLYINSNLPSALHLLIYSICLVLFS